MRSLIFIVAVDCPENDIDYLGNDIGYKDNLATWDSCAKVCGSDVKCFAWSWLSNTYKDSKVHGRCHLKNNNWATGRNNLTGVISGTKNCKGNFS